MPKNFTIRQKIEYKYLSKIDKKNEKSFTR